MNNSTIWWVILIVVILLGSYFLFVNREPVEPASPDVPALPEVTQPLPTENLNETLPENSEDTGATDDTMTEEEPTQ